VFFAQQAAEKALKVLYIHLRGELPPHTHNLLELLRRLGVNREDLLDAAADLTPEYIVTRYPNAVGGVPAELLQREVSTRTPGEGQTYSRLLQRDA